MSAELWILGGTFVVGAGAAVFSWVQASAAVGSREDAKKAQIAAEEAKDEALELSRKSTTATERLAAAQERVADLAEENSNLRKQLAPPVWSQGRQVADAHVVFDNTSGRHIVVESLLVEPDVYGQLMKAMPRPHRVENGDGFAIAWERRYTLPDPHKLTIVWRYEDESETNETERSL